MFIDNLKDILKSTDNADFSRSVSLAYEIAEKVDSAGGRAVAVGGICRDLLLQLRGKPVKLKDIDIEVYGLSEEKLRGLLNRIGNTVEVGVSFAVYKIGGLDVSLPRRDRKTGPGHKGFSVEVDPDMDYSSAARRRSFTITSMGIDLLTGELLDPYNGKEDLEKRILRVVDPQTFIEDSLRVLRGMQFAARFNLRIEPETMCLCRSIDLSDISPERIGEEWMKLLLLAEKPSIGLEAAREMRIIEKLHPGLDALIGLPQEPEWHPEGDVWEHTKMVVDAMARIVRREKPDGENREALMLAALLHDVGKQEVTEHVDGKIRSFNHHKAGVEIAGEFMKSIKRGKKVIASVLPLIEEHMFFAFNSSLSKRSIRRLSVRLRPATVKQLAMLTEADCVGLRLEESRKKDIENMLQIAEELEVLDSMPTPFLTGRMLIDEGYEPGPEIGKILDRAYAAQLNGDFSTEEEALEWLRKNEN